MDTFNKLKLLSDSAKYDVSCSSSGSGRKNKKNGIGNGSLPGICHTWSSDGRCVSLLKVLYTNICIYDCKYCINRISNDNERTMFEPMELAKLVIEFYKRNFIEGLFLSSGVIKSPDFTMELMYKTIDILRNKMNFNGYIHVKSIPGASLLLVHKLGLMVDRMSVNLELPTKSSLKLLAPQKDMNDIVSPIKYIKNEIISSHDMKKGIKSTPDFIPAGQTTQLIIGASDDSDYSIMKLTYNMYKKLFLKRVYYSSYVPVNDDMNYPAIDSIPPLLREHRMYQADWLIRFYKFDFSEILSENNQNFDRDLDPKTNWALLNIHKFPIEINKAGFYTLVRVPGIGPTGAQKIIRSRKMGVLNFEDLKKLRITVKRAKYFITCNGKYYGGIDIDSVKIRDNLIKQEQDMQISMFSYFGI
jgi:putative DNA modification/repair radical SAM protein